MTRLLWKEFRERWIWALLWVIAILAVSIFGRGQFFCGEERMNISPSQIGLLVLTLIIGLGTYASETTPGRALFIFSRPVAWWQVLLAKLAFATVIITITPLLAAILSRAIAPDYYHPFMTILHMLAGAGEMSCKLAVMYLVGMGCSVVLPRFSGSLLTLSALTIFATLFSLVGQSNIASSTTELAFELGFIGSACLGIFCAAVILMRFGLTLNVHVRVARFTAITLPVMFIGLVTSVCIMNSSYKNHLLMWLPTSTTISPQGNFIYVDYAQVVPIPFMGQFMENYDPYEKHIGRIIRMSDNKVLMSIPKVDSCTWADEKIVILRDEDRDLLIVHPEEKRIIKQSCRDEGIGEVTPDTKFLILTKYQDMPHGRAFVYISSVVNLQTGKIHKMPIREMDYRRWVSSDTISYFDEKKQLHYMKITPDAD